MQNHPGLNRMDIILLEPAHLIAMQDYPPLHSPEAFVAYREKFTTGKGVEPIVVVPSLTVIEHLRKNPLRFESYRHELERFLATHPSAKYFMLGGKHRSAAATLLGLKIPCLVVDRDADIDNIHALMAEGKLTSGTGVGENFEKTLSILDDHYFENKSFWSMDEKTKAMIDQGDVSP